MKTDDVAGLRIDFSVHEDKHTEYWHIAPDRIPGLPGHPPGVSVAMKQTPLRFYVVRNVWQPPNPVLIEKKAIAWFGVKEDAEWLRDKLNEAHGHMESSVVKVSRRPDLVQIVLHAHDNAYFLHYGVGCIDGNVPRELALRWLKEGVPAEVVVKGTVSL
jgi:hypothetical protein